MSKAKKRAERELNAGASLLMRIEDRARRPRPKKLAKAARIAQWKKEKAIQDALAENGILPERTLDDYHYQIALRGTTISKPTKKEGDE